MPAPVINQITPSAGSVTGGTFVALEGMNFLDGAIVRFDGVPATGVQVINASVITCLTPTHSAGAVTVTVINPDAQEGSKLNGFSYQVSGSTKRNALIAESQQKINDLSADVPLIEPSVWEQAVKDGLLIFSTDYPQRKQMTVEFAKDDGEYQMPAGLLGIVWSSFNRAVNPETSDSLPSFFEDDACAAGSRAFSFTPTTFTLDHATRNGAFKRGTRFELADDGTGGKLLIVELAPLAALTAKFTAEFQHTVGLVGVTDTDTLPAEHRHRAVACVAEQAIISLMRDLVDDKEIVAKLEDVSRKLCAVYKRGGTKRRRVSIA